mgnify:CR=1 FL=1|tara:strand:+ start:3007 stop:3492 length:486 start_codon:yes stop_codon:yes gene_type:complete
MFYLAFVLLMAYVFPTHYDLEQRYNATVIINKAKEIKEDPYLLIAIAWTESRIKSGRISNTGDYGIFQINYHFWGKKWGFKDRKKFLKAMSDPAHGTIAAEVVLQEMRRYSSCKELNLPACYNGGPGWQKSKNKKKIIAYANKVNRIRESLRRRYPGWERP